jgi:cell division protein ZapA (FtsZ GTPase activity inhibitor)
LQDLARQLDGLMSSLASQTGIGDTARIAILAALHLADELRAARNETSGLRDQIHERSRRLADLLDHVQSAGAHNAVREAERTN